MADTHFHEMTKAADEAKRQTHLPDAPPGNMDDGGLVDTNEAARILSLKPNTLAKWRCYGDGPPAYRAGQRRVVYKRRELLEWLDEYVSN